jgi:hypothetical protein
MTPLSLSPSSHSFIEDERGASGVGEKGQHEAKKFSLSRTGKAISTSSGLKGQMLDRAACEPTPDSNHWTARHLQRRLTLEMK